MYGQQVLCRQTTIHGQPYSTYERGRCVGRLMNFFSRIHYDASRWYFDIPKGEILVSPSGRRIAVFHWGYNTDIPHFCFVDEWPLNRLNAELEWHTQHPMDRQYSVLQDLLYRAEVEQTRWEQFWVTYFLKKGDWMDEALTKARQHLEERRRLEFADLSLPPEKRPVRI